MVSSGEVRRPAGELRGIAIAATRNGTPEIALYRGGECCGRCNRRKSGRRCEMRRGGEGAGFVAAPIILLLMLLGLSVRSDV